MKTTATQTAARNRAPAVETTNFARSARAFELPRREARKAAVNGEAMTQLRRSERNGHRFGPAEPSQPERLSGLPAQLKAGVEGLAGLPMDNVKVHYNSSRPAQFEALAYTRGNEIHLAPGEEKHLPHEAWHVVQQRQGRVRATGQLHGTPLNADQGLEAEADRYGQRAARTGSLRPDSQPAEPAGSTLAETPVQLQEMGTAEEQDGEEEEEEEE